ncbi:DoxX family protein [Flavihumibacter fluvii]|jgi:hypothetical protein|uniref:DoxX family protein n=1 Tax=Flavihumibacter fluvii TaxID=2838157 RepID=UPI001BDDCE3A|nr:DoxX family protein [Flavihumibacter fluvii]ULQ52068.1 DoxX family protein [Flavihumibacter fluvii]
MKKNKIAYWATTGIISLMMLFSGFSYLTNPDMSAAFVHLGFPAYFRIELGLLKVVGAVTLILPIVPKSLKNFAYAGFAITFISAFIAHLSSGDAVSMAIMPLVFLGILVASFITWHRNNVPTSSLSL